MLNLNINKFSLLYFILLFLKYFSFNFNFIYTDSYLFMIINLNEGYFKNKFTFFLKLEKLNYIN